MNRQQWHHGRVAGAIFDRVTRHVIKQILHHFLRELYERRQILRRFCNADGLRLDANQRFDGNANLSVYRDRRELTERVQRLIGRIAKVFETRYLKDGRRFVVGQNTQKLPIRFRVFVWPTEIH